MESPFLTQIRCAPLSGRLPDVVKPGLWTIAIVAATVLSVWVSGALWIGLLSGIVVTAFAVRRWMGVVATLRHDLTEPQQERGAMEQALRRSQKMEALGRLTVGVAHDFNNHLTVISSNVEMVARRLGTDQDRLLRHTDAAMQGVRRAAILSGRLLSFSRQPAMEREAVDVDRLVNDLSELLQRTLGDRIGLEVRLSGAPWFVWVDVSHFENALLSLVVNARDQVLAGGTLRITVLNVQLDTVFVEVHPDVVPGDYIQVALSGPTEAGGWERADDRSSADLFMVRAFVREASGCLLRADPAVEGLSLRLFLPRYVPPSVVAAEALRPTGGRMRILVVEDDAAIRTICVETLRTQGYEVLEAPDAMEAFRLIADHGGIDLLFTDLGLPGGVSGRALADAARNADPAIRVLFTTGYDRVDLPDRAAPVLLRKPFNPAQLVAKVRAVLDDDPVVERSETVQG
jgi:CheY-like chemotaxis protein